MTPLESSAGKRFQKLSAAPTDQAASGSRSGENERGNASGKTRRSDSFLGSEMTTSRPKCETWRGYITRRLLALPDFAAGWFSATGVWHWRHDEWAEALTAFAIVLAAIIVSSTISALSTARRSS